jgi:hypothetical protein
VAFRNLFWKDIQLSETVPAVECGPLRDILATHTDVRFFDIFSLDVEGAELQVLQSLDFEMVGFGVILIEADGNNPTKDLAVRDHLRQNGYICLGAMQRSDWFVNERFNEIYANLMS